MMGTEEVGPSQGVRASTTAGRVMTGSGAGQVPTPGSAPRVCVCILNWNGWADTIECLESVLRSDYPWYRVVVIDNGSTDGSAQRIARWANGDLSLDRPATHPLARLTTPPLPKPLDFRTYTAANSESAPPDSDDQAAELLLLRSEANLGYAGGMNLGLRYALAEGGFQYVWLLNNDTVVERDTLRQLVAKLNGRPEMGLAGSTLVFYDAPATVQALGGFRYNRWLGLSRQLGHATPFAAVTEGLEAAVERKMDGVQGASVLASSDFLRRVGLLSEDYFLYFEEQDWAERGRRAGFRTGYASGSVVYHKDGRSTGNHGLRKEERSASADFYQIQARLIFTRKFHGAALPTVYLGLLGVLANRFRRKQFSRVGMIARLAARTLLAGPGRLHPERYAVDCAAAGEMEGTDA